MRSTSGSAGYRAIVIVVAYNSADFIGLLLEDLKSQNSDVELDVLVVDNCSNDSSPTIAAELGAEVLDTGSNLGYAGAINAGLNRVESEHDYVLILNPDLRLDVACVRELTRAINSGGGIAVPNIANFDGSTHPTLRREPSLVRALFDIAPEALWRHIKLAPPSETVRPGKNYIAMHSIDWAQGCAIMMTAEVARRLGDWDAKRFFLYSEETDLFRRARDAGIECVYAPDAHAGHFGGGSGSGAALVALQAINKVRYFAKYNGTLRARIFHILILFQYVARIHRSNHRLAVAYLIKASSAWPYRTV